jgi:hypothetical protein
VTELGTEAGDARLLAAVDLLRRTGLQEFQLRYSDDEAPIVWLAVGTWPQNGGVAHETAAALDPVRATLRLCEAVIEGGECAHCHRPAGMEPDSIETMPLDQAVCWYQWDPSTSKFVRGCAA